MVGGNVDESVGNENVKSMYMLVYHVHDMYMSRHARNCEKIMYNLCICLVNIYML